MLPDARLSRTGRVAFGIAALICWFGLSLNLVITFFGVYPSDEQVASITGANNPEGMAGAVSRVIDMFSYFTILSNVIAGIVLVAIWRGRITATPVWRTLRMDSLVMITVTGLVFAVVLAPDAHLQGLQYVTNTCVHYLTPSLTVLTFLIWGPRRWLTIVTVFAALIIPIVWIAYTLVRGAVISAYPYGFLDVVAYGYGTVFRNIAGVALLGIVLGLVFLGLDRLLSRRTAAPRG